MKEHGFQCHVGSMRLPSLGMCGLNPATRTSIRRFCLTMSHEQDLQEFRDAIRITREIMHQPALISIVAAISPGVECYLG